MIQRNTNYSIKIKHDYLINHTNMGYLGALPRGNSFRRLLRIAKILKSVEVFMFN